MNFVACATCIPNGDARINTATNFAILIMLIVLAFVLGGVFSFMIYLMRRAQRVDAESNDIISAPFSPTS
jgi:hypothetical protein